MAKRRKPNPNPNHGKGLLLRSLESSSYVVSKDVDSRHYIDIRFTVTWERLPCPDIDALPQATQDRMCDVYDAIHHKPRSVIAELREFNRRHPEVICFKNWLINCLRSSSIADHAEALELSKRLYREHPDYFFARTTLAELWLDFSEFDKAAELMFEKNAVLTDLYPGRKVFHITEITHWASLCTRIRLCQDEPESAKEFRDILAEIEPSSPVVKDLDYLLSGGKGLLSRMISSIKNLAFRK
jgi:hypothetical protein